MSDTPDPTIPPLPRWLGAPENVVYVGMAAWLIATVVVAVTGWGSTTTLVSCLIGLAVGVFGTGVFLVQRRSSRRGDRAAQRGLDG
ncbi:DUF2530 domain-containing protein [Williamsia sp. CHRR-6]|uniref:DUF2530 domain-containing protein n=1 Tax=Williamsia sp. CHRR-6 TaxID=2835871 RepID=UPI001BD998EC|nr:DUF2530 domain-containing protein [Williamsia sp. CHRR-6]MBT0566409.1 DUF2530 domain-containing protein [Williamsia sp. CHRR-6]